jgi:hypothetical protein
MRQYRKDIADLLKAGKLDYAIIRVESVIREQLTLTGEPHIPMCERTRPSFGCICVDSMSLCLRDGNGAGGGGWFYYMAAADTHRGATSPCVCLSRQQAIEFEGGGGERVTPAGGGGGRHMGHQ